MTKCVLSFMCINKCSYNVLYMNASAVDVYRDTPGLLLFFFFFFLLLFWTNIYRPRINQDNVVCASQLNENKSRHRYYLNLVVWYTDNLKQWIAWYWAICLIYYAYGILDLFCFFALFLYIHSTLPSNSLP